MTRTLTLRTVLGAAALALVVAGLFYFMVAAIHGERDAAQQVRVSDDRIAAAIEQQKLVIDLETGLRGYLITEESRFLMPWEDGLRHVPRTQQRLNRLVRGDAAVEPLAREVEAEISKYVSEHGRPLIALVAGRATTRAERSRLTAEGKRRVDHLRGHFTTLIEREQREAAAARAHADDLSDRSLLFGTFGLVGSVLLVIMFCGYQLRFVLRPVRRVGSAARNLADGDLSTRVTQHGAGEVAGLARAFNDMADSLEHSRDELESQNSELEAQQAELERAVDELAEGKERFERLYRTGRAISSATELEDVARTVLEELADLSESELGAIYIRAHDDRDELACVSARGIDAQTLRPVRPTIGLAGRAAAEKTLIAGGSEIVLETLGGRAVARHEVHLPLSAGAEVVGVLTLARVSGGPFRGTDLELLEYLAGRAGSGIANALTLRTARDQAALNRAVLETAADAFISIDSGSAITAWNPAAERLFGWTAEEAIGMRLADTIVPERMGLAHQEAIAEIVSGRRQARVVGVPVEFEARHRDGHEFPIEILISQLERHGEVTFNAFVRDISERRRADLYMGAQYAVTRVLSESSTLAEARDGVIQALGTALGWHVGVSWIVDEEENVLRPTAVWCDDGVDASEFLELTMSSTFARGEPLPGQVWSTGEPVWIEDLGREHGLPRAGAAARAGLHASLSFPIVGGDRFFGLAEFFSGEVERPDPELLSLLATVGAQIGQFSERKRAELEADRLKDEFFALVSHELRTPLTSIIGYLELVIEDPDGLTPDARRFLQVVERNSRRLHRLVGDLLFVAQVEAGRLSLDRAPVPLERVVTDSVEAARPRAEENEVDLRLRIDTVGVGEGDGDRLGQMLDNLISNAVKFTPAGGNVDVYLTAREDRALLEVRDSGVGIPTDEQHRLFQRFFRSSTATERAIPGVGLGLTISRAIVEAHGGTIDFESEEGRGTTFRVLLPLGRQRSTHDRSETPREVVL